MTYQVDESLLDEGYDEIDRELERIQQPDDDSDERPQQNDGESGTARETTEKESSREPDTEQASPVQRNL